MALGLDPSLARRRCEAVYDRAIPGHPLLVDAALIAAAERHGLGSLRASMAPDAAAPPDPLEP